MVKVLTVDDHAPFLKAARDLVDATPGFDSAGEETSAAAGLARIESDSPDLVLADVHMPEMSGIELAERIEHRQVDVAAVQRLQALVRVDLDQAGGQLRMLGREPVQRPRHQRE